MIAAVEPVRHERGGPGALHVPGVEVLVAREREEALIVARLARLTLPLWLYVSVTGVLVWAFMEFSGSLAAVAAKASASANPTSAISGSVKMALAALS